MVKGYYWVVMNGSMFYPQTSHIAAKTRADRFATENAQSGKYNKVRVLDATGRGSKPAIVYTGKVNKKYLTKR
ncbi:hypothetical protein M0R72_05690 [Candidatus Pacearchaeota archaeon]|jgi:hypothetical protein|nr:hypothetical protein [Candidatus Pacearchaeota archaeon]